MWNQINIMNWLNNILDEIRWQAQSLVWAIQDKVQMWKLDKEIKDIEVEEIEVKPKKKSKKKSVKKTKKNI